MANEENLTKLVFRVDDGEGGVNVETPWATDLGNNHYKLDNSPFYAYGVSWEDVVEAIPVDDEPRPVFRRVIEKSGNRTVRVVFEEPAVEGSISMSVLNRLVEMGCSYEGANPRYIAINIPPESDLNDVCRFLAESELEWEHADPEYSALSVD